MGSFRSDLHESHRNKRFEQARSSFVELTVEIKGLSIDYISLFQTGICKSISPSPVISSTAKTVPVCPPLSSEEWGSRAQHTIAALEAASYCYKDILRP